MTLQEYTTGIQVASDEVGALPHCYRTVTALSEQKICRKQKHAFHWDTCLYGNCLAIGNEREQSSAVAGQPCGVKTCLYAHVCLSSNLSQNNSAATCLHDS